MAAVDRADEAATTTVQSRPPRIPSGDNSVWADVSPLLHAACQDLQEGNLIHGDNFNLFAAMSALEIMDPKMDSGMASTHYSLDEAIENGAAPVPISHDKTTDVRCTIDIMDHILACEATWHKGHSLAQTVYSCLYLLRPERTSSHALLHSFCQIIRATCKAVLSVVSDSRTHEEEDLFIMAYGLPLNEDGNERCLALLNAVEETICRQLRACKTTSSKRRVSEDIEPLQNNPDLEEGYCRALLCRLRFRKHFYHLLMSMKRPHGGGLELAREHIASCISEIGHIRKSSDFLRASAPEMSEQNIEDTTASGCKPIGFDASLNCRLSAPTPPRAIKIFCLEKALEYFVKLLHDLDIICSCSLNPSLEAALLFVVKFQKSQPDLVSRAHLQLLLVQNGKLFGRYPMFSMITRAAGLPEVVENHDIQKNEFMVQLQQMVMNLLKIICTNAAWQRRKLGKMLQDWRVTYVQLELDFKKEFGNTSNNETLGFKIFQHILVWVEEQTYWIAFRFLTVGFELELYADHDYCMVYWYIYIVLINLAEKKHLRMAMSSGTGKKKTKKKRDSLKDAGTNLQISPAVRFLQSQIYLAEGLGMMLAALRNEHRIVPPQSPFSTEHEIFIQQFELLLKACLPDGISYQTYKESIAQANFSTLVMCDYFKEAQKIAKDLKGSFANDPDMLAELRRIEQVAERNNIAMTVISRLGTPDPSVKISFTLCHHPFFATAIVKRS